MTISSIITKKPRRQRGRLLAAVPLPDNLSGVELQWLRDRLVAQALSQHSVNAYLADLKKIVLWANKPLSQLTKTDFEQFLMTLAGYKPRGI